MLDLLLPSPEGRPLSVLCLGAHCDDIEIGCGASLLHLAATREIEVTWLILSSTPERAVEAQRSAEAFLASARSSQVIIKDHRDGFLPYSGSAVKEDFEALKSTLQPDLIFTHTRDDLHQDHRLVCDLTWNTFRDHLILEYEIPKWDGDLGARQAYVPLKREYFDRKGEILQASYPSQAGKRWFDSELFMALPRLRGMECNSESGLAEAFTVRKLCLLPAER